MEFHLVFLALFAFLGISGVGIGVPLDGANR